MSRLSMSPEICLHFAGVVLNFFLRVAVAYLACWMANRLLRRPGQRFVVWTMFLMGSGAYWLGLIFRELNAWSAMKAEAGSVSGQASGAAHSLLVPLTWSHQILIAVQVMGLAYAAATLLMIGLTAIKHVRLWLLLRRAAEPSQALHGLFADISSELGVSRAKLLILPGLKSPATAGWWNPRILLPEVCEELGPTPQVADVLCHELVHVERRDYFWAGLGDLICCLLFFHPAVWKARRSMVLQAELACDLAVLEARPGNRADYADSLTYFVRLRMLHEGFSLGVDFAASTSLGLRIRTILAAPVAVPWWKRLSQITAGVALLGAFGVLAPVLSIPLSFAAPVPEQVSTQRSAQTGAEHARPVSRALHRPAAVGATPDTLTTLRTQAYVPETSAYTMTGGSSARPGAESGEQDSPAWRETQPAVQRPSLSSVVRSTLGEIAIRRDGHRDRDDH
ncbi:MAG TPA: M56 family metallopeptidase [Candidatus Angelobacter sp.]|nr:M56 family metallopeptidase [Candidatus Angelobacter sp.]